MSFSKVKSGLAAGRFGHFVQNGAHLPFGQVIFQGQRGGGGAARIILPRDQPIARTAQRIGPTGDIQPLVLEKLDEFLGRLGTDDRHQGMPRLNCDGTGNSVPP